jgi:hypothetical protein
MGEKHLHGRVAFVSSLMYQKKPSSLPSIRKVLSQHQHPNAVFHTLHETDDAYAKSMVQTGDVCACPITTETLGQQCIPLEFCFQRSDLW